MKFGLAPGSLIQQIKTGNIKSAYDILQQAHDLGYEGAEVPQRFLPPADDITATDNLAAFVRQNDLFMDVGLTTVADLAGQIRENESQTIFDQVRRLGGDRIKVVLEPVGDRFSNMWPAEKMAERVQTMSDNLNVVARAAEQAKLLVLCENHIDYTNDELAVIFGAAPSPWVGLMFDTANQLALAEDPIQIAKELGDRIWSMHIKDAFPVEHTNGVTLEWCVPGDGIVPLRTLLSNLPHLATMHVNLELITGGPWHVPFRTDDYWAALPYKASDRTTVIQKISVFRPYPQPDDLVAFETEQLRKSLQRLQALRHDGRGQSDVI